LVVAETGLTLFLYMHKMYMYMYMYLHVYFIFIEESPTSDKNKKILYTAEELLDIHVYTGVHY